MKSDQLECTDPARNDFWVRTLQLIREVYCRAKAALVQYFKFDSFRPGQLATSVAWKGRFCENGYGSTKIPLFFLAPLATSPCAVGVVISPLNALMDQQVHTCRCNHS